MPYCNGERENALIEKARQVISTYEDMAELIRIGAYKRGSDAAIDEAIHYYPLLEKFLTQRVDQHVDMAASYAELASVLGVDWEEQGATGEGGSELDDKGDETCDP
jgi:flagellum-specific ATP synthase